MPDIRWTFRGLGGPTTKSVESSPDGLFPFYFKSNKVIASNGTWKLDSGQISERISFVVTTNKSDFQDNGFDAATFDIWVEVDAEAVTGAMSRKDFLGLIKAEAARQNQSAADLRVGFRFPAHLAPVSATDKPFEDQTLTPAALGITLAASAPPASSNDLCVHVSQSRRGFLGRVSKIAALVGGVGLLGVKSRHVNAQQSYCSCSLLCKYPDSSCRNGCSRLQQFFYYDLQGRCGRYCYTVSTCLTYVCQSYAGTSYC